MTDPLSIAGSVAGLTSLGVQVTQSLVDFYKAYKSQDSEISGITGRLESLKETFQHLEKALSGRVLQSNERSLISTIETSITGCKDYISELEDECQKFNKNSSIGIKTAVRVVGRRVTYPFRQSTLQKLDEDISEIRANLSFALDVLHFNNDQKFRDDGDVLKSLLDSVRTNQISSELRDWLRAPDAFIEHNATCAKKTPDTGRWFVKSSDFSKWLLEENSILWLKGFAGSGNSVLFSTTIQSVLRHRGYDRSIGVAFFYFTFNDESKQDESSLIRALLLQLSSQLQDGYADLRQLYESHKAGMPPSTILCEYLRRLIQRFQHVYLLLDALDESPRNGRRQHVLDTLETMRGWGIRHLHLFVTSRDEPDIRESLDLSATQQVVMQDAEIDKDIANFISARLKEDRMLRRLLPYHDKILKTLNQGAQGVFRWVECQLRSLQSCPRSEDHLDRVLGSLPRSLDETYERMLCNIDNHLIEDARRILTLLCFAPRPLKVQELIDGIAVEVNGSMGLNRKRRLQDSDDIRDICSGFIDIGIDADSTSEPYYDQDLTPTVRIVHFSVQEYLKSERIKQQKAVMFGLNSASAHAEIAQICLVYLLEDKLSNSDLNESLLKEFPLAHFAATYWYHHYRQIIEPTPKLESWILKLFSHQHSFATWVNLRNVNSAGSAYPKFNRQVDEIATPIYYSSLLGLDQTLLVLIGKEQAGSVTADLNAQGGYYGSALQAASYEGHETVVQILLDKGAEVNAQGGRVNNALQLASFRGHKTVVQMLLEKGAEVNAQNSWYGNALQAASRRGHETVVQLLLEKGAEINAQGGIYKNALYAASKGGHKTVVQMLLEKGAEVNAQGGYYNNALYAASKGGHKTVVQMLLDKGADINAQCDDNALYAASEGGSQDSGTYTIRRRTDWLGEKQE